MRIFYDSISDLPSGGGEQEKLMLYDSLLGEFEEIESLKDAIDYIKETYVEGKGIHPDFHSFTIYREVGEVYAEIEDDVCKGIKTTSRQSEIDSLKEQNHKLREFVQHIYDTHYDHPIQQAAKALLNQQH